jgi:hypothetical protein
VGNGGEGVETNTIAAAFVGDKYCDGDGGGNISGNAASLPVGYVVTSVVVEVGSL